MNTKYETPAKDLKRSFGVSRSKTRQLRAHYHACNYDPSKRRRDIKRLCLKKSNFAKQSFGLIIGEAIFRGRRSRVHLLCVTKDLHSSLYPLYLFCTVRHKANNIGNLNLPLESSHERASTYFLFDM